MDAEKNEALFRRVVAGDAAAREEMILGNVPLAVAKVESFIRCFPEVEHLRDDLTSAAFVGLTKAVNQMADGKALKYEGNWNPTDCIGAWINRELGELVDTETPIRLPPRSKYRARANGDELKAPAVSNVIPERFKTASYEGGMETRDLLDSCCTCEEERIFIAMKEAGHTYAEIAAGIGVSSPTLSRMKERLQTRVQRRLEALRDE